MSNKKNNSLAEKDSQLTKQWHPTKNGSLSPHEVTTGSGKIVWWLCEKGHEWKARIAHRSNGVGCPFCWGRYANDETCLQTLNPELAKQWHPKNDEDLSPHCVTVSSHKKVWWQCEKGHEWEAVISSRTSGVGCPYCSGKRACADNNLQTLNPFLAKQWHPTKNGSLTPNDVTLGSNKKVWWQCERGHEWEAQISNRTNDRGCRECSNESQTSFPEQAIYFYLKKVFDDTLNRHKYDDKWEIDVFIPSLHFGIEHDGLYYHKNKGLSDLKKDEALRSAGVYLLRVKETDENIASCYLKDNIIFYYQRLFDLQLNDIIHMCLDYIGCNITHKTYSINVNVKRDRAKIYDLFIKSKKEESLLTKHPVLSMQWHPSRNLGITPEMVMPGSNKIVWWQCERGHEWEERIAHRVNGIGCPYCSGRRAYSENCLQTINPELAKEWHPNKNGKLSPDNMTAFSSKKAWWLCKEGHEWEAVINSRASGNGCPYCAGQRVCSENSLQVLHPEIANQWHPSKNNELVPSDVTRGSDVKIWWLCEKGHEWNASIASRTRGSGCPFCSGNRVCADNSLQMLHPELSNQWHPTKNNDLTPSDVTTGSSKNIWWRCDKGHEWQQRVAHRVNGVGCPYCTGRRVCNDNCLQTLNPELAKQWHSIKNGTLTANDITAGSGKKVWWLCEEEHEWEAAIYNRVNGTGCPYCYKMKYGK